MKITARRAVLALLSIAVVTAPVLVASGATGAASASRTWVAAPDSRTWV